MPPKVAGVEQRQSYYESLSASADRVLRRRLAVVSRILGQRPHPDEQIVTALPKPQIYSGGRTRAKDIARQQGVSETEVEKIAAALWQKPSGASPIEERTACLRKYWQAFDDLHARQKPGMKSLWGLVEEGGRIDFEPVRDDIFHARLYLELLPAELTREIEKLWGTTMLNKYPESIVSEPFPHAVMANVFGPAIFSGKTAR